MNMELLQILHYGENDEYDFHYDYTASDANIPLAGNRIFTFFLYLNDVGGSTTDSDASSAEKWSAGTVVDVDTEDGWER